MPIKTASNAAAREMLNAAAAGKAKPRGNKYGAKPTTVDGVRYDSQHEAGWAVRLGNCAAAGFIENLTTDKRGLLWALDVNDYRIAEYEADARFDVLKKFTLQTYDGTVILVPGQHYVLDAKSPPTRKTPGYLYKKRLMWAIHKIKILEV